MTDTNNRPRSRRRRRPSRRNQKDKAHTNPEAQATEEAANQADAGKKRRRRSAQRRRSKSDSPPVPRETSESSLQVHHGVDEDFGIESLNPEIFIYSYTLRPRSLLDSYQAGPSVAERMEYEEDSGDFGRRD